MRNNLKSDRSERWAAHHTEMYQALGYNPKRHLPAAGMPARLIGDTLVWVNAIDSTRPQRHRVMCKCVRCGMTVAFGRLTQHQRGQACKGAE